MSLRSISIHHRLIIQVLVLLLGLVISGAVCLSQFHQALLNSKTDNTRKLVDTALSVLVAQHQRVRSGELSEQAAQAAAIEAVAALRYDDGNYFWINDHAPRMIIHPTKPELNGKDLNGVRDPDGKALFVEMVRAVQRDGEGSVAYRWPKPGFAQPVAKISYVKAFKPWGWIVGSGVYLEDVHASYWRISKVVIGIGLVIALLAVGISVWISASVRQPILALNQTMSDIASGSGDLTITLPEKGDDELTELARDFNRFTAKIRSILVQVRDATIELNDSAHGLNRAFAASHTAIDAQRSEAHAVQHAMAEMLAAADNIARNAEQSSAFVHNVESEAKSGRNVVEETSTRVGSMAAEIDNTSEIIARLAENSQTIYKVLDVIRGIADQTNLLALNASIEAARAGEQGRGFSVVADEVRTLAAKTQESTDEIRDLLESFSGESEKALAAMRSGQDATGQVQVSAGKSTESLATIVREMNHIAAMIQQTASAAEEQTSVANAINESVQTIVAATQTTAHEFEQTRASERQLAQVSQRLQALVGDFKL